MHRNRHIYSRSASATTSMHFVCRVLLSPGNGRVSIDKSNGKTTYRKKHDGNDFWRLKQKPAIEAHTHVTQSFFSLSKNFVDAQIGRRLLRLIFYVSRIIRICYFGVPLAWNFIRFSLVFSLSLRFGVRIPTYLHSINSLRQSDGLQHV